MNERARPTGGHALFDERARSDASLDRERALVDHAVGEMEGDTRFPRTTRAFVRELREKISRQRETSDFAKSGSREDTDSALRDDHRKHTGEKLATERLGAFPELSAILAQLEVIAGAVVAVRAASGNLGAKDALELARRVDDAAIEILKMVEAVLDPETIQPRDE